MLSTSDGSSRVRLHADIACFMLPLFIYTLHGHNICFHNCLFVRVLNYIYRGSNETKTEALFYGHLTWSCTSQVLRPPRALQPSCPDDVLAGREPQSEAHMVWQSDHQLPPARALRCPRLLVRTARRTVSTPAVPIDLRRRRFVSVALALV